MIGGFEYRLSKDYRNFDIEKMPYFDSRWRPEQPQMTVKERPKITNAANYIKQIRAVSGSGGDKATFRVACVLREAGLSESEALLEIMAWNDQNAEPPWTPRELQYKVECAYMKGAL